MMKKYRNWLNCEMKNILFSKPAGQPEKSFNVYQNKVKEENYQFYSIKLQMNSYLLLQYQKLLL